MVISLALQQQNTMINVHYCTFNSLFRDLVQQLIPQLATNNQSAHKPNNAFPNYSKLQSICTRISFASEIII